MNFYISTTGIKKLTISNSAALKPPPLPPPPPPPPSTAPNRRISTRSILPLLLTLAIVLPFCFLRIAFFVLESAAACSSSIDCSGWTLFSGNDDASSRLSEEFLRLMVDSKESGSVGSGDGDGVGSFNELVKDMISKPQDMRAFAFKTKAMLQAMEQKLKSARKRESVYWHLASHGIPKGLHCLSLKLAEEYAVNAKARARLPQPEYVSRLTDPFFRHVVLLTDNILAASVVVSSAVRNSADPRKLVFHIVTDKKTYTPMHAWFATNSVHDSVVVEVKGLHQFDWSEDVNSRVHDMFEIHRSIWKRYYNDFRKANFGFDGEDQTQLDVLSPTSLSLLNHLRIYVHELFPDLKKVVFLDDDIVVQHDMSSLWNMDLGGNVVGAVLDSSCGDGCCPGRTYSHYLNFSHPLISSNFNPDRCAWLHGMNIFDLEAWRKMNITSKYHQWLKHNLNSGLALWLPGELAPSLMAFEDHMYPIDSSWHVAGLGERPFKTISKEILQDAAVVHFSGPAKPWLEIGSPEVRNIWHKHVNFSNKFIRRCRIM
ncbi:probable galacturonosyltransferase 15 [Cucurbita pepo subsp. pepo]|uniref:probable galacturonosyltransferase 15 n=1 Tax=Cucurbita pepo subsp. pepo TaxID=3664 RepID=UPI000C9D61C6|nr:probable galacturonosyltransferase 15 [Cucurbita pepo subsp. pepo]